MSVRCNTLTEILCFPLVKKTAVFLLLLLFCPASGFAQQTMDEVKKEANKLYEDEQFTVAYKLYSQLVANFPKDPEYNYRLGVCMIYSEPDKKKCITYLKNAAANPKDTPKDVHFYLGKAYHINYLFDEAIKSYNEFKKTASSSLQRKLQVDREIKACNNGKRLLSNLSDLEVKSKKSLNEADYFRSYDLRGIGGKLLVKPDEFKTQVDKKKKEKSVVFLPKGSNVVYFSSYGENTDSGKDIYTSARLPSGEYSKPEKVKGINTEFDEDYPFLHPDGKTLYFASKGHNSMGGYDIFKTTFIEESGTWTSPVNLEFPINSPDDDFLFVTDSLEKTAFFSTGRQSEPGKIDVLKINTERKPIDVLVVKGTVMKENDGQSVKSAISIKNKDNERSLGTFDADDNGEYNLELPNGSKLLFTVETPGLKTQSKEIVLPLASTSVSYKQTIYYEKGELRISELQDENAGDDNYLKYLKQIEKKAKLDVNEGENKLQVPAATNNQLANSDTIVPKNKKENRPQLVSEEPGVAATTNNPTPNTVKTGVDNKQLATLARQDADEAEQEAKQLEQDARDAFETGTRQKIESEKKLAEVNEALKSAESISNEEEKRNLLEKAEVIKRSAENDQKVADRILAFGKSLENDAKLKRKEAGLNRNYASELEANSGSKNKNESLARIEELQKQISEVGGQKNESENLISAIKSDIEQKEAQLAQAEKINTGLKDAINEIGTAIASKEEELASTKKKARKEEISNQIADLKKEKNEKENQIPVTEAEVTKLSNELNSLKSELDVTSRIKTEDIALLPASSNTNTLNSQQPVNTASGQPSVVAVQVTRINNTSAKSIEEKYSGLITAAEPATKTELEQNLEQYKNYTSELDKALADNRAELTRSKKPQDKKRFTDEIKQLESARQEAQKQMAFRNKKLQQLNASVAQTTVATNPGAEYQPIVALSGEEAIGKLEILEKQLKFNDAENFDSNSYQNPKAQALKLEADARINEAVARQKKLKDQIAASKNNIQAAPSNSNAPPAAVQSSVNSTQLIKEAEDLHALAVQKLNESKNKEGAVKEKLLSESRDLEDQSNTKFIELSKITQQENDINFATNKDNLDKLLKTGKSSPEDIAEVTRLNEEANEAYKKAFEIREEVSSQTNNGAKLGGLSNAEEKEAEAIIKQQQAVDILKKSNPDFVLKTASQFSTQIPAGDNAQVSSQLESVNNGLTELAAIKLDSYQKLNEANLNEITEIENGIKNNQTLLDANPVFKSEYIAINKKLEEAALLKEESQKASSPGEQLSKMVASVKKQNEGIKELNALNNSLNQQAAKQKNTEQPPEKNNAVTATTVQPSVNELPANKDQPIKKDQTEPVAQVNTTPTPTESPVTPETESQGSNMVAKDNTTQNNLNESVFSTAKNDTLASKVLSHLNEAAPVLKNTQAGNMFKNSVANLKQLQSEITLIEAELAKPEDPVNSAVETGTVDVTALKSKSETLMLEADELSTAAIKTRKEAQEKEGEEKENLVNKAKDLESQSLDKSIEGAVMLFQANEMEVAANSAAIDELLGKLRNDNPEMSAELGARKDELNGLRVQIQRLRAEAEDQPNKAAKLGAINNAEERELELLQKQEQLIAEFKKQYPDYVVKPASQPANTQSQGESRETLNNKKKKAVAKQFGELTNLTNAFSLEYESNKNNVKKNPNDQDKQTLTKAQQLNAESKRLLIISASEKNDTEKMKLLSQAARLGSEAVAALSEVAVAAPAIAGNTSTTTTQGNEPVKEKEVTAGTTPAETVVQNKQKTKTAPARNTNTASTKPPDTKARVMVSGPGFEVRRDNAYTEERPIPFDADIEDGLIFRVQIGAFKSRLPNNTFKGLNPLNGKTTANGYFRYTAGNFNKYEIANAVKNDLRGLGYGDAFVVAYYNGKRISLAEALDLLAKEGKTPDPNAPQSAGITANVNVPKATSNVAINNDKVVAGREIEKVNGLLFTIQIGVYNRQVTAGQLRYLKPIFTEQLTGGLFRYTAGIYNNADRVIRDKNKVVELGVKDAFVSAYLNGKKITFASAREKQNTDASIKMENEDPVIFSGSGAFIENQNTTNTAQAVQPFSNGVTGYPEATAGNGVKNGENGICFKVQIGAYSKQVPADIAEKFNAIKAWPVENKLVNGLYIYNIGNFTEASFAKTLKDEALKLGLEGAFITVYKDGRKLYGAEATALIGR